MHLHMYTYTYTYTYTDTYTDTDTDILIKSLYLVRRLASRASWQMACHADTSRGCTGAVQEMGAMGITGFKKCPT